MRGGFVACLAAAPPASSRLESAAAHLRWHVGEPAFHRRGGMQVACLVDDAHGPWVEINDGRLLLCHGAQPEPLEMLAQQRDRFVGLESDGLRLRTIRDRMGEVPLFYRRVGDEFWLATEIHPLLAVAPAEPDLEWLSAFSAMVEFPDATGWLGVRRALPGEILQVDHGLRTSSSGISCRGWDASWAPISCGGRPVFESSSRRRRKTLVPALRVLLSGGLDSSAVAVVAARTLVRPC